MAIFRVEKNKNYTVMSNYHLKDRNLSLKSKGLLSVILSLPDDWNYTTRGLATICKEGVDCIGASLRELEAAGYLERNMLRDERGRIADTEYIIYEFPQAKSDTDAPDTKSPCTGNSYTDESDTEKPAQYKDTNIEITQALNTDESSTHQSIASAVESFPQLQPSYPQGNTNDRIDEIYSYDEYREIVYGNIEYEILCERYERVTLDEIMETMLDYICGRRNYVRIGRAEYPAEIVKGRLLKLDSSHIEYVIERIKGNTTKIRNIRAYLLAVLYNAPTTMEHYYTTLVAHDMANYKQ